MKAFDPLLKLIVVIWSIIYFLFFQSIWPVTAGFILIFIISSIEYSVKKIISLIYGLKYWFLLIFLLEFLIFKNFDIAFYLIIMFKLIGYWLSFGLLFLNVDSGELFDTLIRIKTPYFIASSISITVSLVERYYQDLIKIKNILSLRGFNINPKKPFLSAKSVYNLLVPIFVLASFRSKTTSIALMTKNWGYTSKRTIYKEYRFGLLDYFVFLMMILTSFFAYLSSFKTIFSFSL